MGMILTDEQQAILDGAKGETMAKVMKTLVMFGEAFHAEKMVPVTSRYNHLVTSFGLGVLQPVYDLMQQLIDAGAVSGQKFSADPRPLDPNVPANLLQQLVFKKFMYNKQDFYEGQLEPLGYYPYGNYPGYYRSFLLVFLVKNKPFLQPSLWERLKESKNSLANGKTGLL